VTPIAQIQAEHGIVGRERELELALAVLSCGRHLLMEGPVGVGKTTVALAVCAHLAKPTVRIDGDDRYSEAKLTGWFDPPLVLSEGFSEASFFPGPLIEAMRSGAVLFVNELNRMPESVQNVLLPALDERLLVVPHIGLVEAAPGFQVVATQNPSEYVATGHLSEALNDRFDHLALSYQSAAEERAIVARATGSADPELIAAAVRLTRATRRHPAFRKGASVRAAIACVELAARLPGEDALKTAARAALATRTELRDDIDADFESALEALFATLADDEDEEAEAAAKDAAARAAAKKA
jgi:MoxR-like ATPase